MLTIHIAASEKEDAEMVEYLLLRINQDDELWSHWRNDNGEEVHLVLACGLVAAEQMLEETELSDIVILCRELEEMLAEELAKEYGQRVHTFPMQLVLEAVIELVSQEESSRLLH